MDKNKIIISHAKNGYIMHTFTGPLLLDTINNVANEVVLWLDDNGYFYSAKFPPKYNFLILDREEIGGSHSYWGVGKEGYQIHDIRIERVNNGVIVHVGCQLLVFSDLTDFIENLTLYLTNPEAATKKLLPDLDMEVPYEADEHCIEDCKCADRVEDRDKF